MKKKKELIPLTSYDQEPEGMTEAEAREFWDTHAFTEEYLASAPPVSEDDLPPVGQLREYGPIELDFEVFRRARWLARQRGIGLENLLGDLVYQAIEARSAAMKRAAEGQTSAAETSSSEERAPMRATGT